MSVVLKVPMLLPPSETLKLRLKYLQTAVMPAGHIQQPLYHVIHAAPMWEGDASAYGLSQVVSNLYLFIFFILIFLSEYILPDIWSSNLSINC